MGYIQEIPTVNLNKISAILKDEGCKEILLFGSHVTGHANENSDIDIGVKGLLLSKFLSVYARLDSEFSKKIDFSTSSVRHKMCLTIAP